MRRTTPIVLHTGVCRRHDRHRRNTKEGTPQSGPATWMIAVEVNRKMVIDGIDDEAAKEGHCSLFSGTSPALTLDYYRRTLFMSISSMRRFR